MQNDYPDKIDIRHPQSIKPEQQPRQNKAPDEAAGQRISSQNKTFPKHRILLLLLVGITLATIVIPLIVLWPLNSYIDVNTAILMTMLLLAGVVVGLINVVVIPILILVNKIKGPWLRIAVITFLIGISYSTFMLKTIYDNGHDYKRLQTDTSAYPTTVNTDNSATSYQVISIANATDLIKACKIKEFFYVGQSQFIPKGYKTAENTATGIVLTNKYGQPYRISVAKSLLPTMVPIALQAQKTCPSLIVYNDGRY